MILFFCLVFQLRSEQILSFLLHSLDLLHVVPIERGHITSSVIPVLLVPVRSVLRSSHEVSPQLRGHVDPPHISLAGVNGVPPVVPSVIGSNRATPRHPAPDAAAVDALRAVRTERRGVPGQRLEAPRQPPHPWWHREHRHRGRHVSCRRQNRIPPEMSMQIGIQRLCLRDVLLVLLLLLMPGPLRGPRRRRERPGGGKPVLVAVGATEAILPEIVPRLPHVPDHPACNRLRGRTRTPGRALMAARRHVAAPGVRGGRPRGRRCAKGRPGARTEPVS
mmetsp:Transcript_18274/g.59351  ORF Transcript_18274/g.59351 Transcript_18274/m.59351 type:complete len:277 (+) Transcript_18274:948-1778(+)